MDFDQQLLAAGLVLTVFVVAAGTVRRRGWLRFNMLRRGGRNSPQVVLIDRLSLTPHHQLHMVRVNERTLLLATHSRGIEVVESPPAEHGALAKAAGNRGTG